MDLFSKFGYIEIITITKQGRRPRRQRWEA